MILTGFSPHSVRILITGMSVSEPHLGMSVGRGGEGRVDQGVEGEGRAGAPASAGKYPAGAGTREKKGTGNQGAAVIQDPEGAQRFANDKKARSAD